MFVDFGWGGSFILGVFNTIWGLCIGRSGRFAYTTVDLQEGEDDK